MTIPTIQIDLQIRCIEREIKMRITVYPRLVANGKMSQTKADNEYVAMCAVLETLRTIEEKERLI